jgi:hypothetical protein
MAMPINEIIQESSGIFPDFIDSFNFAPILLASAFDTLFN